MTTSFNTFSKNGLIQSLGNATTNLFVSSAQLRVFPSTVSFPSSPAETLAAIPSGHILTFTSVTYTASSGVLTATGGTLTANTTAAGTLSWWAMCVTAGNTSYTILSDSISLNGGTGVVYISNSGSSLTVTNGQTQTLAFNLQIA